MTFEILEQVIGYSDKEEIDLPLVSNHEEIGDIADKLNNALDILAAANFLGSPRLHATKEQHAAFFIRWDNVRELKKGGKKSRVNALKNY